QLTLEIAVGDAGHDLGDTADLSREIGRHRVDVVGEILPGAGDAFHFRLPAELALGSDLARHARDLGCEGVELVHHCVDGVLELQNFATHVDRDFTGKVVIRHGGGYRGDVTELA